MKKKIFICIFSLIFPILGQTGREEKKKDRLEIESLLDQKKFAMAQKRLQSYTEKYPYELNYVLLYGKSILMNESLSVPKTEEEIFSRNDKIENAKNQYKLAANVLNSGIQNLENRTPDDKSLSEWYFYLALSESYLGNKKKAIRYFQKSYQINSQNTQALYNLALLEEQLNLTKESQTHFRNYIKKTQKEE